MSRNQSDAEVLASYIEIMGGDLGLFFHRLRNHAIHLHFRWHDYVEIYGKDQASFEVMNAAAPHFFSSVQDMWWSSILLGICRFADKDKISGRQTLSLASLSKLAGIRQVENILALIDAATHKAKFAQDWRNRTIAHADLDHELDRPATPLAHASRENVRVALSGIATVIDAIEMHFTKSTTYWGDTQNGDGGYLLRQLKIFHRLEQERQQRRLNGATTEDDQDWDKWHGKF